MKIKLIILILVLLFVYPSDIEAQHSISISASLKQNQDFLNNGMVFEGPAFSINYSYMSLDEENAIVYNPKIGVGILFNRGILGITTQITPVDFFYGFKIDTDPEVDLFVGPRAFASYNLSLYPDLQSGLDFWVTNFNISPNVMVEFPFEDDRIRAQFSASLFGMTSRTPENRDPYFFSLKLVDLISDLHSNLEFGSVDKFFHTTISAEYLFGGRSSSWTLGYDLNYFSYFDDPELKILSHSMNIKYNFGGKL